MTERKWTDAQIMAINSRGVQTLVSAAAGSGKTAVLTERVKNILCDTENPCSVNELLVVTFTKAAASEMRDKIAKLLKKACETSENSAYLKKQLLQLPAAEICTMDSFCSRIVKDNFTLAGVSPDFQIMSEGDLNALKRETVEAVIDAAYDDFDDDFKHLVEMFLDERNDGVLSDLIISLYDFSRSYPSPDLWLDSVVSYFEPDKDPGETPWVGVVCSYISLFCDYYIEALHSIAKKIENNGGFTPEYIAGFYYCAGELDEIKKYSDGLMWDETVKAIYGFALPDTKAPSKVNAKLKTEANHLYGALKDDHVLICDFTLPNTVQHARDCSLIYGCVKKICSLVKTFSKEMMLVKTERDEYSFDDITHKCIDILVDFSDGTPRRTPLAVSLSEKYKEILIDEYQDTNEAQNMVFTAVSRDLTDFYCVGDIKQSIYRFRLACPDLFAALKDSPEIVDGKKVLSKIILEQNFRSRKGITECVNFIFSRLMSRTVGEIDYNEKEYLYYGADYPGKTLPDIELHYSEYITRKTSLVAEDEAARIAAYIKNTVESGITVGKDENRHKIGYGDFCILLRSPKSCVDVYSGALKKLNIPSNFINEAPVGETKEVNFFVSLLQVVCNPLLDVPLTAVLMSPVFGFSADDLARIRLLHPKGDLYNGLVAFAAQSKKASDFLAKLSSYRNIAAAYPVYDFVRFVADDTGVEDIYLACTEPNQRSASLKSIIQAAYKYTSDGKTGLTSFVRYLNKLIENNSLIKIADSTSGENSVKILSIHKSKGLEFPYVILANCFKGFNKIDTRGNILSSRSTGIGFKIRENDKLVNYHTLSSAATKLDIEKSGISEELRVLYVALTRAAENLAFFCTVYSKASIDRMKMFSASAVGNAKNRVHPFCVYSAKNMNEWILPCLAFHPDCGVLREKLGLTEIADDCTFSVTFCDETDSRDTDNENTTDDTQIESETAIDEALLELIKEKTSFTYSFDGLSGVLAKRTASSLESHEGIRSHNFTKPAFLNKSLAGAQKGTAVHKFLEKCDFAAANDDSLSEAKRLLETGELSEEECAVIDHAAVKAFFDSDIGKRALRADELLKEYEFSVLRNACDLYDGLPDEIKNEQIVVEGKIDCAFTEGKNAVIIDYKTDNINDENALINAYAPQIEMYAAALAECKEVSVTECYLYSFKMKKFIKL